MPLLLLMATTYPMEPERLIDVSLWGLTAIALGSIALTYIQFDRDEFTSWLSKSDPHRVTFDGQLITRSAVAVLPVIGVLLAQFPDVADLLSNYLGPLFRSLGS